MCPRSGSQTIYDFYAHAIKGSSRFDFGGIAHMKVVFISVQIYDFSTQTNTILSRFNFVDIVHMKVGLISLRKI